MLFTDEFLESLKLDPIAGAKIACHLTAAQMTNSPNWTDEEVEALEEFDLLLSELSDADMLPDEVAYISVSVLQPTATLGQRTSLIKKELDELLKKLEHLERLEKREKLASRIRIGIGKKFAYEFSQGDVDRVQTILNELRTLVSATKKFKPEHQQRLLARLEALQKELHKKVSDLDRFWGLIGDAGVILAKLGNDAKPIVDRVREVADIVFNTQARAEELPSSARPPQIGYEASTTEKADDIGDMP